MYILIQTICILYDVPLKVYKEESFNEKKGLFKFEKLYYFMNAMYVMKCHEKIRNAMQSYEKP